MVEWIEQHYKMLTGIVVPIALAIIGIFKGKRFIRKQQNKVKGNNNSLVVADSSIVNNQTQNSGSSLVQIQGNNNQVNQWTPETVEALVKNFHQVMYPHLNVAFQKIELNIHNFLTCLNTQLASLSQSELEKFSEADVQIALQNTIKSAARKNSLDIHQILCRLIADRVQKPRGIIAELAINEAIEVSAKLDVNLIKILAFNFIFSRTKFLPIFTLEELIRKLLLVIHEFNDLEISVSKFEYLEAVSCGKVLQTIKVNNISATKRLINIIQHAYPHLFFKKISHQQLIELNCPDFFIKIDDNTFQLASFVAFNLYATNTMSLNGNPLSIQVKQRLINFFNKNYLSEEEVNALIINRIPGFETLSTFWDDEEGCSCFRLTAVGIAIGRAYLEQKKFGNYDINLWIN